MSHDEHLKILKQGAIVWCQWREDNPEITPDLSGANLKGAELSGANLRGTNFREVNLSDADLSKADLGGSDFLAADLSRAYLYKANLSGANFLAADLKDADIHKASLQRANLRKANLQRANLRSASLSEANLTTAYLQRSELLAADLHNANLSSAFLSGADLREANLSFANLNKADCRMATLRRANLRGANLKDADLSRVDLSGSDLRNADLNGANLMSAVLVETNLSDAKIANCNVYGISAWDLNLTLTEQSNLIITRPEEPTITVDNLEVAQFIYLLLNNKKIRDVIDTITSKVVLILGRFTPERKVVLDKIREELRSRNYSPILFDFDKPASRDITETISTLAHMARFIIADITDAKSIPQELMRIVPGLPSVPVQPLLLASQSEYGMFEHLGRFPWVLEPLMYDDLEELLAKLPESVIAPAESKTRALVETVNVPSAR
jgi:uncharacterized protein YjbI with pentapeptide repeats